MSGTTREALCRSLSDAHFDVTSDDIQTAVNRAVRFMSELHQAVKGQKLI